jgi:cell wall assembly regulator SMI1
MQRRQMLSLLGVGSGALGLATLVRRRVAAEIPSMDAGASSMTVLWQALEAWLQQEIPELLADLNPGCSEVKLTELERRLDCQLPADFKAFYKIHDGQRGDTTGLFFGLPFLSTDALYDHWSTWRELSPEDFANEITGMSYPPEAIIPTYINLQWIPFTHDGSGNHLGIDLAPGPTGTLGQVINFGPDELDRYVLAPSLEAFVRWTVDQYQSGNVTIAFRPEYGRRILTIREPAFEHFQDALPQLFRN